MSRDRQTSSTQQHQPAHRRVTHQGSVSPSSSRVSSGTSANVSSSASHRAAASYSAPTSFSNSSARPQHAQAPINAATAAHRAAHARTDEVEQLRRAAAGGDARGHARAAQSHARVNAHAASPSSSKHRVILVSVLVGLVLAVVLLGVAGHALVSVLLTDDSASEDAAVVESAESTTPEDVVALTSDGGTIELNDRVYMVASTDDGYAFVCQDADASDDALTLFTLSGEPVGFAIHQGTFYVVSNADGSFYVQTYVPSDGSVPSDYQQGEGTIADIAIEDGQLVLTDDAGTEHAFDLPQA